MNTGAYLYILRCADGSYYVGTTRKSLDERLGEHNAGVYDGYTAARRPVSVERQVKGWSRAKKEALVNGAWDKLPELAKRRLRHAPRRPRADDGSE